MAPHYTLLNSISERSGVRKRPFLDCIPNQQLFISLLAFVLVAFISFSVGRSTAKGNGVIVQLSTKPQTFHYQRIYGEVPSNTSDAAWSTLFPIQGGFFKHPSLAPQRSAFSVFHQLHCLDGIRHGYWAIYSAAITGHQISEEDIPFMSSPPHIRHCIDLIRQSLMCQPDLTVELKEKELGGVTGFGTEHQCRDWGELLNWLEEWEGWAQDPKDGDNEHVHHDHNH